MCESLFSRIDQLKRNLRSSQTENRRLLQLLEKRKIRENLECPVCLREKENWLSVQCGDIICHDCVLDLMKREALFNKPCPLCQTSIKSLTVYHPNLR